jgi:hypothetical protein
MMGLTSNPGPTCQLVERLEGVERTSYRKTIQIMNRIMFDMFELRTQGTRV